MGEAERPSAACFGPLAEAVARLSSEAKRTGVAPYKTQLPAILQIGGFFQRGGVGVEGVPRCDALLDAVAQFDVAHGDCAFAIDILPSISRAAAKFNVLFPGPIGVLAPHEAAGDSRATFTKRQCHCILSAAFLCLFPRASRNCTSRSGHMPSINYDEMHAARGGGGVEVAKLLMALDYFREMADRIAIGAPSLDDPGRALVIVRRAEGAAAASPGVCDGAMARPLTPVVMHELGESIDDQKDAMRVDFANAIIGGASLSFGCVQEEVMFSICPEMNVARLVCAPMEPHEAIVLLRAEQFSEVAPGTYAFSLRHGRPHTHANPSTSVVTCIDAMDYRSLPRAVQYSPAAIHRELVKAVAGFGLRGGDGGLDELPDYIATGNWGCGAFLGDPTLKIIIQWAACCLVGRQMHYYPFDDPRPVAFAPLARRLAERRITAGQLFLWLTTTAIEPKKIFGQLARAFGIEDKQAQESGDS